MNEWTHHHLHHCFTWNQFASPCGFGPISKISFSHHPFCPCCGHNWGILVILVLWAGVVSLCRDGEQLGELGRLGVLAEDERMWKQRRNQPRINKLCLVTRLDKAVLAICRGSPIKLDFKFV